MALLQRDQVQREDFYFNQTNIQRRNIMIRKMLFVASAVAMIALITAGLTLGLPAKATTSAVATPAAVQGCNFPITINKIDVGARKPGGGHPVSVVWGAPATLPNCVSVSEYKVYVKLQLPKRAPDNEITVAGDRTSATVDVPGLLADRDPVSVTATVTAVFKTTATAKGSKSEPVTLTP
jgi:hypothetical protein